jgi:excisionase family DNA binding protein
MGLFRKSKKITAEPALADADLPEENESASSVEGDNADVLNLGWYYSENKEEFQLAKIKETDRTNHFYVIGATGTGKTKFLEYLIRQDIEKGNGFGVIDPHGDLIEDIKGFLVLCYEQDDEIISDRIILIDPADPDYTVTFNPLEKVLGVPIAEQANELISAFRKIWSDSWGVRMEDLMRNSLIALAEAGLTLTELPQFLTHRNVRQGILEKVSHPLAQEYFKRFDTMTDRSQVTWIEPVMNKINAFFSDERIRHIFSSEKSSFNIREIMDHRKILLIKLDKGKLKDSADLLGSLLMAKIQMAAFSRSDILQRKRIPFYMYIDEFQNFATESFSIVLSEARKYGLSLIMAHQTLAQIPEELRSLILGNTGIQVYFRLNRHDATALAKEAFEYSGFEIKSVKGSSPHYWSLSEEWERYTGELQALPPRVCYVKHKIQGGVIAIRTADIDPIEDSRSSVNARETFLGRKYLVERTEIAGLIAQRQNIIKDNIERTAAQKKEIVGKEKPKEAPVETGGSTAVSSEQKRTLSAKAEELGADEENFLRFVSEHPGMFVTKIYKALNLSGYKGDRFKESLIEQSLLVQEETRKGLLGRLAKVLNPTDKGVSLLNKSPRPGKGGDAHKRLQAMLKEQAEVYGWKAVVEERIPRSLESVDVGLAKDDMKVAIEISSTTKPDQEIRNIRKCLDAGYDYVISVSEDEKSLSLIKNEAKKNFTLRERERTRFSSPEKAKELLSRFSSPNIVSEKAVVSDQISREKQLLSISEAAERLGIRKNTLYEWVVQRKIPYIKVGRLVKFRKEDLEAWIEDRFKAEKKNYVD